MPTTPILIEETFTATTPILWKALTDKDQMKQWFFDIPSFRPVIGIEFQFYGEGKQGEKYLHLCKIINVIPEKKLQYSWRYEGYEGISYVSVELLEEGNQTNVKLTHEGVETFPVTATKAFAKQNFVEGWTYLIRTSLKNFLEKE